MTLLLEGKESRAHAMMEEFQFTGDTPALYYAQAAWEYKHNNPEKAADWASSANKIYSPALNTVFADAFYDVGWMKRPEGSTAPALAFDTTNVVAPQTEGGPAVEPSPIAANKQGEASSGETLALGTAARAKCRMEIASADATAGQPTSASSESGAEPALTHNRYLNCPRLAANRQQLARRRSRDATGFISIQRTEQSASPRPNKSVGETRCGPSAANASSTPHGRDEPKAAIVGGLLLAAIINWLVIVPVVAGMRSFAA
jgi:hypothetical protein